MSNGPTLVSAPIKCKGMFDLSVSLVDSKLLQRRTSSSQQRPNNILKCLPKRGNLDETC